MIDKYAALRDALAAGPTPGPWRAEMVYDAGYAHINFDSREWNTLRGFCGEANAAYIAAAHPEAIRALLAERDALVHDNAEYVGAASALATENQQLREALTKVRQVIAADRQALLDAHGNGTEIPATDELGSLALYDYDGALHTIDAALAQEQGD